MDCKTAKIGLGSSVKKTLSKVKKSPSIMNVESPEDENDDIMEIEHFPCKNRKCEKKFKYITSMCRHFRAAYFCKC